MYFRRYTRMHLYPALKYFSKYGLLDKPYQKFMPLITMQDPQPDHHHAKRRLSKVQLKQKDLDTKLIDRLFLKYPDLKYEPISHQKFAGRKFNTFSYAFSFITQQKKFITEGYTEQKAFEIVQKKYQDQMQRKLDQTVLSRGLALGNRARSFLTLYQQQVQYQSKLKVQRTRRQLQKYEQKLTKLRSRIEDDQQLNQNDQFNNYERVFQKIVKEQNLNQQTVQSGKKPIQARNQTVNNIQKELKNVFNQFYQRVSYKDKLQGLTDQQIINNIHSSPNKIKRQNKLLIQFLKKKGSITVDHVGQIRVSQTQNPKLRQFLLTSPQVKIALLTQRLNYEKPSNPKNRNVQLMNRRSNILRNRPDKLTPEEKELIKYNKKVDMQMAIQTDLPNNRQSYKIFQSNQQRLLRLQLKYLNMVCQNEIQEMQKKRAQSDAESASKHKQRYEEAQSTLKETIEKFRRIKYRLETKFKRSAVDEFIFSEHTQLNEDFTGEEADFEQLLLYLRKRSEQRRLTSISQANDNRIHSYLENQQLPQYPLTEGQIKTKTD